MRQQDSSASFDSSFYCTVAMAAVHYTVPYYALYSALEHMRRMQTSATEVRPRCHILLKRSLCRSTEWRREQDSSIVELARAVVEKLDSRYLHHNAARRLAGLQLPPSMQRSFLVARVCTLQTVDKSFRK